MLKIAGVPKQNIFSIKSFASFAAITAYLEVPAYRLNTDPEIYFPSM